MFEWAHKLKGKYVCIEGPDGVGKTTLTLWLMSALEENGLSVVYGREPGSTPLGEQIRELLLTNPKDPDSKRTGETAGQTQSLYTQFYLFAASREHFRDHVIEPAKAEGKVVLSDRGSMSSHVYQGAYAHREHLLRHRADIQIVLTAGDEEIERRLAVKREAINQFDDTLEKRQAFRDVYAKVTDFEPYYDAITVDAQGDEYQTRSNLLNALEWGVGRLS